MVSGGGCPVGDTEQFILMVRKLFRFGLVGIAGAAFDYGSRAFLISVSVDPTVARGLSYAIGSTVAYLLNSYYTFDGERSQREKLRATVSYVICFFCAVVVDHLLRMLFPSFEHILFVSWVASQAVATTLNFLLQNFWVFKKSGSRMG